jgi:hypothetical protein
MSIKTKIITLIILILALVVLVPLRKKAHAPIVSESPVPVASSSLPQVYEGEGFSILLPEGYTVKPIFKNEIGPGFPTEGVKFTISTSTYAGTNLSGDSYISYESIPNSTTCSADMFDSIASSQASVTEGDISYSVASSSDAAAGNRYDQKVYAFPGTNPCVAIHYFIHYGRIENYPEGNVKEFDEAALLKTFDSIRKTLVINQ